MDVRQQFSGVKVQPFFEIQNFDWYKHQEISNRKFLCGYCSFIVSSNKGYPISHRSSTTMAIGGTYICPSCLGPTFLLFDPALQSPSAAMGNAVRHLPKDLEALYEEARRATSQNCFTGSVLLCRKMLMNIAVNQGANEGLKFIEYVNYLSSNGYIPPNGKHWVDHIRTRGNEATHEISVMTSQDAQDLISFIEMLLRFIYEFPAMVPQPTITPK